RASMRRSGQAEAGRGRSCRLDTRRAAGARRRTFAKDAVRIVIIEITAVDRQVPAAAANALLLRAAVVVGEAAVDAGRHAQAGMIGASAVRRAATHERA